MANTLDEETIIQEICAILDIDYEEIKNKLAAGEKDTESVQKTLEGMVPDDKGGAG